MRQVAPVLLLVCLSCTGPYITTDFLQVNHDDTIHYRTPSSVVEGERALVWLARTSDREEAWIYTAGSWYEVGENATDDSISVNTSTEALLARYGHEIRRYHIHPALGSSTALLGARQQLNLANRDADLYWQAVLATPSDDDIRSACRLYRAYRGRYPVSYHVVSAYGIVTVVPLRPYSPAETVGTYSQRRAPRLRYPFTTPKDLIIALQHPQYLQLVYNPTDTGSTRWELP